MLEFLRIAEAIHGTLDYYKLPSIKTHLKILSGKESNPDIFESSYQLVFVLHKRMEAEINQTIQTSNHNAQVFLFEALKDWLQDPRISDVYVPLIEREINLYNDALSSTFALTAAQDTKNYNTKYGHLNEGDEYEESNELSLLFRITNKKVYRKIYCIETTADYIDTAYLPDYLNKLNALLVSLKSILTHYTRLYDQGKIKANDTNLTYNLHPELTTKALLTPQLGSKLKVSITVEQLTILFRLLKEAKVIDVKVNRVIHQFIADNFETEGREGIIISASNVGKLWSSTDTDVLNFLISKLIEMQKIAKAK